MTPTICNRVIKKGFGFPGCQNPDRNGLIMKLRLLCISQITLKTVLMGPGPGWETDKSFFRTLGRQRPLIGSRMVHSSRCPVQSGPSSSRLNRPGSCSSAPHRNATFYGVLISRGWKPGIPELDNPKKPNNNEHVVFGDRCL